MSYSIGFLRFCKQVSFNLPLISDHGKNKCPDMENENVSNCLSALRYHSVQITAPAWEREKKEKENDSSYN